MDHDTPGWFVLPPAVFSARSAGSCGAFVRARDQRTGVVKHLDARLQCCAALSRPPGADRMSSTFQIALVGCGSVGKSSLGRVLSRSPFRERYNPTIGVDFDIATVETESGPVVFQVWDTAGSTPLDELRTLLRDANACVLVFSLCDKESFDALGSYRDALLGSLGKTSSDEFPFVVLGNKCDRAEERAVTHEKALEWCNEIPYFEVSAKDGSQVSAVFEELAKRLIERGKQRSECMSHEEDSSRGGGDGPRADSGEEPRKEEMGKKVSILKLLIQGDARVGKTSILQRFTKSKFSHVYKPTIGADFEVYNSTLVKLAGVSVQVWDTSGDPSFRAISSSMFKGAAGLIFAFDVNSSASFEQLRQASSTYVEEAAPTSPETIPIIVLGNKIDESDECRAVSKSVAEGWCLEKGWEYFEVSAKDDSNIEKAFHAIEAKAYQYALLNMAEDGTSTEDEDSSSSNQLAIQCSSPDAKLSPGDAVRYDMEITNSGDTEGEPFDVSVGPGESTSYSFTLIPVEGTADLFSLSRATRLRLECEGEAVANIVIESDLNPYANKLKELPPVRVSLWGMRCIGKSSLINTIATAFACDVPLGESHVSVAAVATEKDQEVIEKQGGFTSAVHVHEVANITIVDTWGFQEDNCPCTTEAFKNVVTGKWGEGTTIDMSRSGAVEERAGEACHVAAFVCSPEMVGDNMMEKYMSLMQYCDELGLAKLRVVRTFVDETDWVNETPSKSSRLAFQREFMQLGVPYWWVSSLVNYTAGEAKCWGKTRDALEFVRSVYMSIGEIPPRMLKRPVLTATSVLYDSQ